MQRVIAPRSKLGEHALDVALKSIANKDFLDLLPASFDLDGRPFNVRDRRPMFAPLFRKAPSAKRIIFMSSRQIGKTASIGGHASMNCAWRANFRYTYVAPLALYVSRFHHIYMAKMIRSSRLPWALQDKHTTFAVTEKTFTTGSHFHGVSCFNSAGNALGIPADCTVFDEVQDLNFDFIPQILEIMGTSSFGYELYFGTARGKENTIQKVFDTSSQAEFCIRCGQCGHWNIPTAEEDAISMIQKKGVSCSKCCTLLHLESGQWVHAYPSRAKDFVGLHIPQTIVKDRVYPYEKYLDIWNKLYGVRKYSSAKFMNEVLGISVEMGSSPITPAQIRAASVLDIGPSKPFRSSDYSQFGGGVDWGGNEITSFTVGTLVGLHPSGVFHCVNAIRPTGIPENERHLPLSKFFRDNCPDGNLFAIMADGAFVGGVQNRNLSGDSGIQVGSIHYGSMKKFFTGHPNNQFTIDRTTLLFIVFSLIKDKLLLFPSHEAFTTFTEDLKSVFVEEVDTKRGTFQKYSRRTGLPDDFLHSLGYSLFACALGAGIDLPSLAGLSAQSSITRDYIDAIGTEMAVEMPIL